MSDDRCQLMHPLTEQCCFSLTIPAAVSLVALGCSGERPNVVMG